MGRDNLVEFSAKPTHSVVTQVACPHCGGVTNVNIPHKCQVPCDYMPRKSYPYFRARSIFDELANGSTAHGI